MNVFSCFDGASCGQLALTKLGVPISNYYASEIDKYAIQVTQANFPNTIQLGDITKVDISQLPKIDLMMGGSPCQGFSFAGKQLNFEDPRSKLFFDFIKIRDKLKPRYVLLENVRMKKESEDIISDYMGCSPIKINSSLLSAQSRNRLYWFVELVDGNYVPINVNQPQDKGIVIKDILEELPFGDIPNYLANTKDGLIRVGSADLNGHDYLKRVYSKHGKAPALTANGGGNREPKVGIARIVNRRLDENGTRKDYQLELPFTKVIEIRQDDKSNCLTTLQKDNVVVKEEVYAWRKLTPLECERLQTMPDNYTNHVSNSQRYKMIGNGWTVDVIAHILKGIQHG